MPDKDMGQKTIDGKRPMTFTVKVGISGGFSDDDFSLLGDLLTNIETTVRKTYKNAKVSVKI